jgi:hypothetical protein
VKCRLTFGFLVGAIMECLERGVRVLFIGVAPA